MNPQTLLSTPTTTLAAGTTSMPTTLVMLGLLAVGCWLLFSGSGHGGGAGSGGQSRSRRGGSGPLTLIVIGLLIGATATGSAAIHKVVTAFSGAVNALSGLFH
jgi:hypothetical protein